MRRSSCVSLGSSALSGWDRSVSPTVRSRRGPEPDAQRKPGAPTLTGRCEPARLGKENAELRLDREILANPGRLFCRGDDPVTRFGVRFGIIKRPIRSSVRASPVGCSRSGLPGGVTGPCRRATALMGNQQRSSTSIKGHRGPTAPPRVHDGHLLGIETLNGCHRGPTAPPRVHGRLRRQGRRHSPKPGGSNHGRTRPGSARGRKKRREANGRGAPGPDLVGRDFTADASNQRRVTDICEFGCVDAKLYRAGILTLRPRRRGPLDGATPDHRSRRQRPGHGLGQTNPVGDLVVTPTGLNPLKAPRSGSPIG